MIQTLKCKKCSNTIKIDYSKAPKDEFIIGCPSCNQKYKLKKPQPTKEIISSSVDKVVSTNIKSSLAQNQLDSLKKGTAQVKVDSSKIDPKNNWAYNLYNFTRRVSYLNKLTLFIYLLYLSKSISKTLSEISISKIDQESFLKLKAETTVISSNIFNSIINPILKENEISPNLLQWATSWFVKKLSVRIIINILDRKAVDKNLPFIKKYIYEVERENQKIFSFFTNQYSILIYFLALILIPISFNNFHIKTSYGFWPSLFLSVFLAGLPILLANYKSYNKTKSVFIGNLAFWLLVMILPLDPESSILNYALETFDRISYYYVYFFSTISLLAIISDYMQSEGKNIVVFNKFIIVFKPLSLALSILIPFLTLTLFSSITKYKVSYDELNVFREKNTYFDGYWYFLNSDSTKVNSLYLTCNADISSDESGDIDLVLITHFNRENTIKLNKYKSELKLKEYYSFEIKYPIVFKNVIEIKSCKNNILKGVLMSSSGKKVAITAAREPSKFDEAIRLKQESIERLENEAEFNDTIDESDYSEIDNEDNDIY